MAGTAATPPGADRDENPPMRDTGVRRAKGGGRGGHRGLYWPLPALAFLGVLLLGGTVIAAGLGWDDRAGRENREAE